MSPGGYPTHRCKPRCPIRRPRCCTFGRIPGSLASQPHSPLSTLQQASIPSAVKALCPSPPCYTGASRKGRGHQPRSICRLQSRNRSSHLEQGFRLLRCLPWRAAGQGHSCTQPPPPEPRSRRLTDRRSPNYGRRRAAHNPRSPSKRAPPGKLRLWGSRTVTFDALLGEGGRQ